MLLIFSFLIFLNFLTRKIQLIYIHSFDEFEFIANSLRVVWNLQSCLLNEASMSINSAIPTILLFAWHRVYEYYCVRIVMVFKFFHSFVCLWCVSGRSIRCCQVFDWKWCHRYWSSAFLRNKGNRCVAIFFDCWFNIDLSSTRSMSVALLSNIWSSVAQMWTERGSVNLHWRLQFGAIVSIWSKFLSPTAPKSLGEA